MSGGEVGVTFPESRLEILLVLSAYLPATDYGGPVSTVALLAPAMSEAGHSVAVLTADFGFGRSRVDPGTRMVNGLQVRYAKRITNARWSSIPTRRPREIMRGLRPDVVHCFGLRDPFVTSIAHECLDLDLPVVLEPMGMAVPRVRSERLKATYDNTIGRTLKRRAAAVVATSQLEADELMQMGFQRIVIRANPINSVERVSTTVKLFDLCYVGRLHAKKQLALILEVLAQTKLTAIIAGPDDDGTLIALRRRANELGVSSRVTFRGWVDKSERETIFASSRCFVLPSVTENFGNVVAEAMAAGLPAVVSDMCGVAEFVGQAAGRVVSPDASGVLSGIVDLFADPTALVAAGEAAAVAVRPLEPKAVALAQAQIYNSVVCR